MLQACFSKGITEAGCDEAGRGCLAGPVFAAAVILPDGFKCEEINDSKQISEKKRYNLRPVIEEEAVDWGVGIVECYEIDKLNIYNASYLAMFRAVMQMKKCPEHLIIDGKRYRHPKYMHTERISGLEKDFKSNSFGKFRSVEETAFPDIPADCVVKGDGKYMSIAAASILAKTYRDDYMNKLHEQYPYYNWLSNKGYPTKEHRQGIIEHGISEHHRLSYNLIDRQLELF